MMDLPEYEPRPDLWNRIEADLDFDDQLAASIGDLPAFEPKADLWDRIDEVLTDAPATGPIIMAHPARTRQMRWGRSLAAGVAAACLILIGTYWLWQQNTAPTERIEYAVEQQPGWPNEATEPLSDSPADQRAEAFIEQQCAEAVVACQRPEVRELRAQLSELTQQQQRLHTEQQRFGDDPALIRAQAKLDNQRADITKELITLLRS